MESSKIHLRHCLLYEFQLGHSSAEAHRNLVHVFGQEAPSARTCDNWMNRFKSGDFSLSDKPRSGRQSTVDNDLLRNAIKADPFQTTRELAESISCSKSAIAYKLHELGFAWKIRQWIPYELSPDQRSARADACLSNLSRSRRFDWLDSLITGDEKWVLYVSHTARHAWIPAEEKPPALPKGGLNPRKEMLSVFWDVRGIVYWELCPSGSTVNSEVYCNQLQKLSDAVRVTRPEIDKIYFLHDNARPHTSTLTRQKLQMLGWEVIPHPPYSPDLAPTDYHLFRSLAHFLEGKRYDDRAALEIDLRHFFESKPPEFYRNGIHSLPNRWRTVIDKDGRYFDE